MTRTLEDIQKEYSAQCALLGDISYKLTLLESDKRAMMRRLRKLNAEAKTASEEKKDEPAAV